MELLGLEEQEERITAQQQEGSDAQARAARLEAAGLEAVAAFLLDGSMGASKECVVLRWGGAGCCVVGGRAVDPVAGWVWPSVATSPGGR